MIRDAERKKKTGVTVKAFKQTGESFVFIGDIDIIDLKPGMLVREIGSLREVADTLKEDDVDYLIPLISDNGTEYYSPLCIE